jgi:type I restriction enzyme S subunit
MTKAVLLGNIADVLGGGTPSTKSQDYWGNEIAWITPRDLSNHQDMYISSGQRAITNLGLNNSSAKLLPKETVIFSSRAPIGYVTIASIPMTTNQGCKGIICNPEKLHNKYLYYWLKNNKSKIEGLAGGSTFKEISTTGVRNLEILLPDIETQKKIADVLRTIDEKIELNRKMNETLEQMGQALFRHYFITNPEAENWPRVPVSELCEKVGSGGTPATKRDNYYGGDVQWYSTKELNDCFLFGSEKTISEEGLNNSSAKLFPKNTVMMAIYAAPTVGRLGILTSEASFNQAACGLVAKPGIGFEFIYLYLLHSRTRLNNMANGAAQQNISVGKVREFKTMLPDKNTLTDFRIQIEPIFERIKKNSREMQTLTTLRDTLLPRLINGTVKV